MSRFPTSVVDELRASSAGPSCTGRDDLLSSHGLRGLYRAATKPSLSCPYQQVEHAVDKRIFVGEAWSLAAVAEWPDHEYEWTTMTADKVRASLLLPFKKTTEGSSERGGDLLADGDRDRGLFVSGSIDPFKPSEQQQQALGADGARGLVTKIKIKIGGGAKRPREEGEVRPSAAEGEVKGDEGKKPKIE